MVRGRGRARAHAGRGQPQEGACDIAARRRPGARAGRRYPRVVLPARSLAIAALCAATLLAAPACARRSAAALVAEPLSRDRTWVSPHGHGHPLLGKIWDVAGQRFVDEAALEADLARATYVVLGETHDNADDHLLQARLLRALTAAGRRPAVAFEMLDTPDQPKVDAALDAASPTADDLARAVDWAHGGWPAFSMYRPIFEAAIEARLPIVAASLPRKAVSQIVRGGDAALPPAIKARLDRDAPLTPEARASYRAEMQASHCGELPESMLDPMILAQRARDAQLAGALLATDPAQGAVLVAGSGHARTDRAVPVYLRRDAPDRPTRALSFMEVDDARRTPAEYASEYDLPALPFDYVVFTAGAEREDPCAGFREHMKKKAAKP